MSIQDAASERTPLMGNGVGAPLVRGSFDDSHHSVSTFDSLPYLPHAAVTVADAENFWNKPRRWRCIIEQIKLDPRSCSVEVPILKFTLGGPAVDPNQRLHAFKVATEPLKGLMSGNQFQERYNQTYVCPYPQLDANFLSIQLYEAPGFCGSERYVAMGHISMKQLATGSTLQRISLVTEGADRRAIIQGKVSFRCRFEELVRFRIRPRDWIAANMQLKPELFAGHPDPANMPFRFLQFALGSGKPSKAVWSSNPAFPQWKDFEPVFFEGSMVELRSSYLRAVILAGASDRLEEGALELGSACIPLLSILEAPFVRAPIVREEVELIPSTASRGRKQGKPSRPKKRIVAVNKLGSLQGYTSIESELPLLAQSSGIPRRRLPHHAYLCVRIEDVHEVETSLHTHFRVTAEWRDFVQHTKAFPAEKSVTVDQTLHFPISKVEIEDLQSKWFRSGVSILGYECLADRDECRSYLGGFEIDIKSILSAPMTYVAVNQGGGNFADSQPGRSGDGGGRGQRNPNARGGRQGGRGRGGGAGTGRGGRQGGGQQGGGEVPRRVHKQKTQLVYLGKPTPFTVTVSAWFEPEVPTHVRTQLVNSLESVQFPSLASMSGTDNEYDLINSLRSFEGVKASQGNVLFDLEEAWRKAIPARLLSTCDHRIQMSDEYDRVRFLPTYLARYAPTVGLDTPELVEATVQRMEWIGGEEDEELEADEDVLSSDDEDGSDGEEYAGEGSHSSEAMKGEPAEQEGDADAKAEEEEEEEQKAKEDEAERVGKEDGEKEAKEEEKEETPTKAEKETKQEKEEEEEEGSGSSEAKSNDRQQKIAYWTGPNTLIRANAGPHPAQVLLHVNLLLGLDQDAYICVGRGDQGEEKVWVLTRGADGSVTFWNTRKGSHYTLEERWVGRTDKQVGGFGGAKGTPKIIRRRVTSFLGKRGPAGEKSSPSRKSVREHIFYDEDASVPADEGLFPDEEEATARAAAPSEETASCTPGLKTIEIIFNHRNLWANLQVLDPGRVLYDLEISDQWHPIFKGLEFSRSVESYWGMPFYVPKRLSPPLVPSVAAYIVKLLHDRVQSSYIQWRRERRLETVFDESLSLILTEGLFLAQEKRDQWTSSRSGVVSASSAAAYPRPAQRGLKKSESLVEKLFSYEQMLDQSAPDGFHISRTVTVNFKFFDPVRVCNELLAQHNLHTSTRACKFGVGCLLIPYHNFSCSLWVGIAQLHGND